MEEEEEVRKEGHSGMEYKRRRGEEETKNGAVEEE